MPDRSKRQMLKIVQNYPKLFYRILLRTMPRKDITILNPNGPDLQGRYDLNKRYGLQDEAMDINEKTLAALKDIMPSYHNHSATVIGGDGPTLTMQVTKNRGKSAITEAAWDFNPVPFADDSELTK